MLISTENAVFTIADWRWLLIKHSHLNSFIYFLQQFYSVFAEMFVYIKNNIPDLIIGFQVLSQDIDPVFAEGGVDLAQHARHVLVYM